VAPQLTKLSSRRSMPGESADGQRRAPSAAGEPVRSGVNADLVLSSASPRPSLAKLASRAIARHRVFIMTVRPSCSAALPQTGREMVRLTPSDMLPPDASVPLLVRAKPSRSPLCTSSRSSSVLLTIIDLVQSDGDHRRSRRRAGRSSSASTAGSCASRRRSMSSAYALHRLPARRPRQLRPARPVGPHLR
jgi:hypothetical protein